MYSWIFFFFNDTATTEIYTLSLHDALPISRGRGRPDQSGAGGARRAQADRRLQGAGHHGHLGVSRDLGGRSGLLGRSEEHTSELQSLAYLVCRLLLEKKKIIQLSLGRIKQL